MENEYSDELINWGDEEGTRESYDRKRKQFYDEL